MPLLSNIMVNFKRFLADDRGAAGIEFLCTLPLLIGTMVFTAEYGNALRTKMVLTTATADVTRFLSRTPIEEDPSSTNGLRFYTNFLSEAQAMLDARMDGSVTLSTAVYQVTSDPPLRTDPIKVLVQTDIGLTMPLLGFINRFFSFASQFSASPYDDVPEVVATFITMTERQDTVWIGGSDVGAANCSVIDHGFNVPCGTSAPGT